MKIISENKIIVDLVISFFKEMTIEYAERLKEDKCNTPFHGSKEMQLVRDLAINRLELTTNYIHLLDQEPFDEN